MLFFDFIICIIESKQMSFWVELVIFCSKMNDKHGISNDIDTINYDESKKEYFCRCFFFFCCFFFFFFFPLSMDNRKRKKERIRTESKKRG